MGASGANKLGGANGANGANSPSGGGGAPTAFDQEFLRLVNEARAQAGLNPLQWDPNMEPSSEGNNTANLSAPELGHYYGVGENGSMGQITAEDSGGETPQGAFDQYKGSPGHWALIMSPDYTYMSSNFMGSFHTADFH
jgi:uncharacterized protein YkwD